MMSVTPSMSSSSLELPCVEVGGDGAPDEIVLGFDLHRRAAGLDGGSGPTRDVRRSDVVGEGLPLELVPAPGFAAGLGGDERFLDDLDDLFEGHLVGDHRHDRTASSGSTCNSRRAGGAMSRTR